MSSRGLCGSAGAHSTMEDPVTNLSMPKSRGLALVACASILVLAAGGGGAVAGSLITSKDIQDKSIKKVDLAKNSVVSTKVKDGTLKLKDLDKKANDKINKGGPAGPAGPAGRGSQGPQGPKARKDRRATPGVRPSSAPTGASSTATSSGTATPSCDLVPRSGRPPVRTRGHRRASAASASAPEAATTRPPLGNQVARFPHPLVHDQRRELLHVHHGRERRRRRLSTCPACRSRFEPQRDGRLLLDAELPDAGRTPGSSRRTPVPLRAGGSPAMKDTTPAATESPTAR